MNITDEFAKVIEEKEKINSKYEELFREIFKELNKYFSFIIKGYIDLKDKTIIYENYDKQEERVFKVALYFKTKDGPSDNPFCFVVIKSRFNWSLVENIIERFCMRNKIAYEDLTYNH
nr:MAG TPA: hypothetical protein [Caudoviricetes sp.]